MAAFYRKRLGDILVAAGLLTTEQLEWALEEQKQGYRRLGKILMDAGWVTEDDISEARSFQLDIPYVQLGDYAIDPQVIRTVPESLARTYRLVPISKSRERLAVAMADPLDVEAIDATGRASRCRIEPLLASESRIMATLDHVYGSIGGADINESIEAAVSDTELVQPREDVELEDGDLSEVRRQSTQAPVVRTVNLMIEEAIKRRASDVHLEPRQNAMEVRYRIDGTLRHIRDIPKPLQLAVASRVKIMSDLDIAERRVPQDGRVAIRVLGHNVDLRVSTLPVHYGERIVMRILDKSSRQFSLDQLGFSPHDRTAFEKLISKPHGIILVTGPTGSGKTTTLYTALTQIKSPDINIMTCEDPIEYELEGVNQSAINVRAGLTFARQLRAILRQDPDVILVGEVRDSETADIAFRAALTGHLVLTTLHANDAPSTITRLIDMDVEPFLIASSVIGIVAQRLVRSICPRCKTPYTPGVEELAQFGLVDSDKPVTFYKGQGCNYCDGTGYHGRQGVFEVMTITDQMRQLVLTRPSVDKVRSLAMEQGMVTMGQNGLEKVLAGTTTSDEIRRKIFLPEEA